MTSGEGDLSGTMQYWTDLLERADAGAMEIPEGVAFQCDKICADYIDHLADMLAKTKFLVDLDAFGTLPSAQQLGRKFKRLADGAEGSAAVAIQQHIEVIELMRSVFRRYFVEAEYADHRTAQSISTIAEALAE